MAARDKAITARDFAAMNEITKRLAKLPVPEPKRKLKETALYLGDNGRVFCGTLRCAGQSSYFTGRDISGQRVMELSPEDAAGFACETCRATA